MYFYYSITFFHPDCLGIVDAASNDNLVNGYKKNLRLILYDFR